MTKYERTQEKKETSARHFAHYSNHIGFMSIQGQDNFIFKKCTVACDQRTRIIKIGEIDE